MVLNTASGAVLGAFFTSTRVGAAVAWHEGAKLRLARLAADGQLVESSTWGKSVQRLCEGVASNDAMFGVGWLEADGKVWVVHGPVLRRLPGWDFHPLERRSVKRPPRPLRELLGLLRQDAPYEEHDGPVHDAGITRRPRTP